MEKKILTTPISDEDIKSLKIGDIVYLTGTLVTCRDTGHKRRVLSNIVPKTDLKGGAVFHAGPIVKKIGDKWEMVSIGPTTSMRMEKFEKEFLEITGAKIVIGKGGMGSKTVDGCVKNTAVHAIFPGGCAVVAASQVEEITDAEWLDLGMPEAFWVMKVKEFGPLIISIDTKGNNLFENNKAIYKANKEKQVEQIAKDLSFMKY
ncbi:MAG TPA: L(+)-tartrate dehydratase subunit beta [Clostridia bacterium]|mgnify:CR=1 FL=1|jgi:L(+)-tartrate dehydratase beta subunit|nr:L(+)-tartrate dehydratase subunit beta [Clostridia bacterium]